jgi:hypothetical protein
VTQVTTNAVREGRRLVRLAAELIADETSWTKHALARDCTGSRVAPGSRRPKPTSWCLLGALLEAELRLFGTKLATSGTELEALPQAPRFMVATKAVWHGAASVIRHSLVVPEGPSGSTEPEPFPPSTPTELLTFFNDFGQVQHGWVLEALDYADGAMTTVLSRRAKEARHPKPEEHAAGAEAQDGT